MADFSATVEAALDGVTIACARLARFNFLSGIERVWEGFGDLATTGAGTFRGIGAMGRVGGIDLSPGAGAEPITLTLTGLETGLVAIAKDQKDEVLGRAVVVLLQFFDATSAQRWLPLDEPYPFFSGRMDTMSISLDAEQASIEVKCNHILSLKHRPPYGMFTDADQQARFAGDLGLERVASYRDLKTRWP